MDEFGMGSHSTHTQHGAVVQPDGRSAGGSSGGSAVAVAQGWCDAALGTDTGGSVRLPAAWTAVFGFKPSYGRVSRRGVVAYANSLDTVGFLAKDVRVLRRLFEVTDIHDPEDPTSLSLGTRARLGRTTGETGRRLRIGVPTSFNIHELDPTIRHAWTESLKALHAEGHTLHAITLPSVRAALSAYYVLAPAEASSNLAKYDGVRYGGAPQTSGNATSPPSAHDQTPPPETNTQQPLFTHHRTTLFGPEVRRRILLGTYTLSADAKDNYFIQAQRVRRTVVQEFDAALRVRNPLTTFPSSSSTSSDLEVDNTGAQAKEEEEEEQGVDAILCPTAPTPPPHLDELLATSGHDDEGEEIEKSPADAYVNDVFTVPASLAGLPAVSVPVAGEKIEDKGVGMQIITQLGEDEMALKLAEELGGLMR
ncbi:MAG: Trimeric GatFAB AmidoTransferase(AdT) complex subunit [Alyxoria varia]|nr:MAG: Trimeric GatFAB AmidoTransferase(AdT) complex subunit [Alyxoria varia]